MNQLQSKAVRQAATSSVGRVAAPRTQLRGVEKVQPAVGFSKPDITAPSGIGYDARMSAANASILTGKRPAKTFAAKKRAPPGHRAEVPAVVKNLARAGSQRSWRSMYVSDENGLFTPRNASMRQPAKIANDNGIGPVKSAPAADQGIRKRLDTTQLNLEGLRPTLAGGSAEARAEAYLKGELERAMGGARKKPRQMGMVVRPDRQPRSVYES